MCSTLTMHQPKVEHCTTAEAAEILGVDRTTVSRLVKRGDLEPAMKLPGKTGAYLLARADVERLRRERSSASPALAAG